MLNFASMLLADIAPRPDAIPEVVQQSGTGMIIGGIALAVGVVLLGVWLVKRKSPGE
jgi:hypothetical protein